MTFTEAHVLRGIPPQLATVLAALADASLDEMGVALQILPYGDRAVLSVYEVITMGNPDTSGVRKVQATEFGQQVAAYARQQTEVTFTHDRADLLRRLRAREADLRQTETVQDIVNQAPGKDRG